ncbi:MAG: DUF3108 domain-containing protein [Candidatus Omnitrophota bacterium]
MKNKVLIICYLLLAICHFTGCATNIRMRAVNLPSEEHTVRLILPSHIEEPLKSFNVGEELTYDIGWNGIPVGYASMSIKAVEKIGDRDVYVIESTARSNEFLSKIYPIEDIYRTYIDTKKMIPLKFEKKTRDGRHTSHDLVEFDHDKKVAHYTSLKTGEKKDVLIAEGMQDMLSCIYYFRMLDLKVDEKIPCKVYVREKIYDLLVNVEGFEYVTIKNLGNFYAFKVQPLASFRGIFISRGKGWILVSTDKDRLPIAARIKVAPFGSITCVLTKKD